MTDGAAKPVASPAPAQRGRNVAVFLIQYVPLQIVIAALCIFVVSRPLPSPPDRYGVPSFSLRPFFRFPSSWGMCGKMT